MVPTVRIRCKLILNESPECFLWALASDEHAQRSFATMTVSEMIKKVETHIRRTEGLTPAGEGSKHVPHHLGWRLFCFIEGSTEGFSDCKNGEVSGSTSRTNKKKSLSLLIARRATSAQNTNENKKQFLDAVITYAWASKINAETIIGEIPKLLVAANEHSLLTTEHKSKRNHADLAAETASSSASLCGPVSLSNATCFHIDFVFVFDTSLQYVQLACDLVGGPRGCIPTTAKPTKSRPFDERELTTFEFDGRESSDIDYNEIDRRLRPVPADQREMLRIALINCFQRKARALKRGESTKSDDDLEKVIMITIENFAVLEVD